MGITRWPKQSHEITISWAEITREGKILYVEIFRLLRSLSAQGLEERDAEMQINSRHFFRYFDRMRFYLFGRSEIRRNKCWSTGILRNGNKFLIPCIEPSVRAWVFELTRFQFNQLWLAEYIALNEWDRSFPPTVKFQHDFSHWNWFLSDVGRMDNEIWEVRDVPRGRWLRMINCVSVWIIMLLRESFSPIPFFSQLLANSC